MLGTKDCSGAASLPALAILPVALGGADHGYRYLSIAENCRCDLITPPIRFRTVYHVRLSIA